MSEVSLYHLPNRVRATSLDSGNSQPMNMGEIVNPCPPRQIVDPTGVKGAWCMKAAWRPALHHLDCHGLFIERVCIVGLEQGTRLTGAWLLRRVATANPGRRRSLCDAARTPGTGIGMFQKRPRMRLAEAPPSVPF